MKAKRRKEESSDSGKRKDEMKGWKKFRMREENRRDQKLREISGPQTQKVKAVFISEIENRSPG